MNAPFATGSLIALGGLALAAVTGWALGRVRAVIAGCCVGIFVSMVAGTLGLHWLGKPLFIGSVLVAHLAATHPARRRRAEAANASTIGDAALPGP